MKLPIGALDKILTHKRAKNQPCSRIHPSLFYVRCVSLRHKRRQKNSSPDRVAKVVRSACNKSRRREKQTPSAGYGKNTEKRRQKKCLSFFCDASEERVRSRARVGAAAALISLQYLGRQSRGERPTTFIV